MKNGKPIGDGNYFSKPIKCKNNETAWYNPVTQTFNLEEIPNEMKILIQQIGYKKKDLKNPKTAKAIFDILNSYGLNE